MNHSQINNKTIGMTHEDLLVAILELFAGMRAGEIQFTPQKDQIDFHTHIREKFNDTFLEFFDKQIKERKLTKEDLQQLQSRLLEFEECYNVKEAGELAKKAQSLIDEES